MCDNQFWVAAGIYNSIRFPPVVRNNELNEQLILNRGSRIRSVGGEINITYRAQKDYISFPLKLKMNKKNMLLILKKTSFAIDEFHKGMNLLVKNNSKHSLHNNNYYEELLCNLIKLYIVPSVSSSLIIMNKKKLDLTYRIGLCIRTFDFLKMYENVKENSNTIDNFIPDNVILIICEYILYI